jgi:hypothetical protein
MVYVCFETMQYYIFLQKNFIGEYFKIEYSEKLKNLNTG